MDGDVTPLPLLPLEDNERTNLGDVVGFIDQANLIEQVPDGCNRLHLLPLRLPKR